MGFRALVLATSAGLPMVVVGTSVLGQSPTPAGSAQPPAVAPQSSAAGPAAKPKQPNVVRPPVRREVQPQQHIVKRPPAPSTTLPVVTGGTVPAPELPVTGQPVPSQPVPSQPVPSQPVTGQPGGQTGSAPTAGAEPPASPATSTAAPAQPPADMWSPEAITAAKQHCDAVLKGVDAVYVPEEPIKHGVCGAPAVVRLMSVGKGPEIVLSPPAVVTCDMVAAMAKWVKADVQPLARTTLGSPVVKIETMSSYSCRNAYGRSRTNLSEHGRANALDIGAFVTASNDAVRVLTSWGLTNREVRAIAAKAEAEKAASQAAAAAAAAAAAKALAQQKSAPATTGSMPQATPPSAIPGVTITEPATTMPRALGLSPPSRLGGAKDAAAAAPPSATIAKQPPPPAAAKQAPAIVPDEASKETRRLKFLRAVHASACKHFGTVLGPEANNDHKNHFHVDMAPRRSGAFCE